MAVRTRTRVLSVAAALAALATGGFAAALAASPGPTPVAPATDKAQARGVAFTFKVRAPAGSKVFLRVGTSKRVKADGTLASEVYFREMVRRNGMYQKKTDVYPALGTYFLNRRGTYYWQAYRIACATPGSDDCSVEGPVRRFTIR